MITRVRWKEAQAREAVAWQRLGSAAPTYLERRGAFVEAWLRLWGTPLRRVLEIGGAGLPAVDFLPRARVRHAADPLMREYARLFATSHGIAARAEELPYADGCFDAVLMLNVIDHAQDPARCLAEAARVLSPEGILLLSCNVYSRLWLLLREARVLLLGERNNDILHPHHFTASSLLAFCARRFEILDASKRVVDPLAGERAFRAGGGRLKGEARLYVVGRPC